MPDILLLVRVPNTAGLQEVEHQVKAKCHPLAISDPPTRSQAGVVPAAAALRAPGRPNKSLRVLTPGRDSIIGLRCRSGGLRAQIFTLSRQRRRPAAAVHPPVLGGTGRRCEGATPLRASTGEAMRACWVDRCSLLAASQ